jgi:hypothetical protein
MGRPSEEGRDVNERDGAPSHGARVSRPTAGEVPHSLRNRLKDADPVDGSKQSDEREELQSAARAREPAEPEAKRRRLRRNR